MRRGRREGREGRSALSLVSNSTLFQVFSHLMAMTGVPLLAE